jgi:hypothetical protein
MSSAFPGSERCSICNELLTDPEDHAALGRITDNPADPLHAQNHAHFHRTCLAVWPQLSALIDQLEALEQRTTPPSEKLHAAVIDLVTLRSRAA